MNVLPIANYLEQKSLGEVGKSIFVNTFPATAQGGILVRAGLPGMENDPSLPGYFSGTFQVIVRKQKYEDAQNLAIDVALRLQLNEVKLGSLAIKQMYPTTAPVGYVLSDAGFVEFGFKVQVNFVDESWVQKLMALKS